MSTHFLFNSSGEWIAFRRHASDNYLFDCDGEWVGWFPWGDDDAVDTDGNYLGTIVNGNRLVSFSARPYRGYPGYPRYPVYPGYPGYAGYSPLPLGAQDIHLDKAA